MESIQTINHILIVTRRALDPFLCMNAKPKQVRKKKMEAMEIYFLQRMLRISRTAKKPNEPMLRVADTTRSLINRISRTAKKPN